MEPKINRKRLLDDPKGEAFSKIQQRNENQFFIELQTISSGVQEPRISNAKNRKNVPEYPGNGNHREAEAALIFFKTDC